MLLLFVAIFTAAMMLSASLATSDGEIRRVLRERGVLARALVANVAIVPLLAFALRQAFHLTGGFAMGAVLAAVCPGAPFGTYVAARFRQDVALAMVLTCGLTLIGLATVPITSWLIFGSERMAALPRGSGLLTVAIVILLPVALGRAIRRRSAAVAARIAAILNPLAFVALVGASLAAAGLRSKGVRSVGWHGSLLIIAIVAASIGVGWLCGRTAKIRATLGTSTGLRNVGLAYLYAEYTFPGTSIPFGVAAYSILMLPPALLFAAWMRRRRNAQPTN